MLFLGSVALAVWWWFGGLADAVIARAVGQRGVALYIVSPIWWVTPAALVMQALRALRRRLVRSTEPSPLVFEGDPQDGWRLEDQPTLKERLVSARRRADEAGKALADAARDMQTAAWQCVASGMAYSDTAALARVDPDRVKARVAEVSDAWGSPAEA